jgi:molybdenum cofactor synthesis domain-containing protein
VSCIRKDVLGVLLIGNEILNGQVQEENLSFSIRTLQEAGHQIGEVRIIQDKVDDIARSVSELSERYEYVITSGGVGPTHDDVTMPGVAQAFSLHLSQHVGMVEFFCTCHPEPLEPSVIRMTMLPAGAQVIPNEDGTWPVIRIGNCFLLPGYPPAFRHKLQRVAASLPEGQSPSVFVLYLSAMETEFAEWLGVLQERHPLVSIGSYPAYRKESYRTRIVLQSLDPTELGVVIREATDFFSRAGSLISTDYDGSKTI